MKRLLIGLAVTTLVTARPEMYREKEDFQYSRSSSDDGTKSGYYDAQRGNMGGNYERAHNMDTLAQHQMGGLMKQVQGEIGDGSKTKSGNVFTSASSQGFYGSGRYDLSSLGNRNFQDGVTYEDSHAHSANRAYESHSASQNNARYSSNSHSQSAGYNGYQAGNLQDTQQIYGSGGYEQGSQSERSSRYNAQSGYQGSTEFGLLNTNQQAASDIGSNSRNSLGHVHIIVRPGTKVAIPVNAQATRGTRVHSASYYDENSVKNDAELLNSGSLQTSNIPSSDAKHYESSYSYRKQWEKHDTNPAVVPLAVPTVYQPSNSELYDESRLHSASQYANTNYQDSRLSSHQANINTHASSLSQIRDQANFNAEKHSASSSSNSDAFGKSEFNSQANSHSSNLVGAISSKPKSYHSSYSYHKSWERQGDPYVIEPISQTSERLTDLSSTQNQYSSLNYGSRQSHQGYSSGGCVIECEPTRHLRKARSYGSYPSQSEDQTYNVYNGQETQQSQAAWQDVGQQSQNKWDNLEDLGQQTQNKWDNLEELGQQAQNKWDSLEYSGQQTQNSFDKLEDLGQQTQNSFSKLEDLGQQTQNSFDKLEDLGQQTQNSFSKLEDLGQQTQNKWDDLQDLGQQSQNKFDNLEELGQQTQTTWDKFENLGQGAQITAKQIKEENQQTQDPGHQNGNEWHVGQETQNTWNNLEAFGQQYESPINNKNNTRDEKEHTETEVKEFLGQETQNVWNQFEEPIQVNQDSYSQHNQLIKNITAPIWEHVSELDQSKYTEDHKIPEDHPGVQATQNLFRSDLFDQQKTEQNGEEKSGTLNNLWGKLDNLEGDFLSSLHDKQGQSKVSPNTSSSQSSYEQHNFSKKIEHNHNFDFEAQSTNNGKNVNMDTDIQSQNTSIILNIPSGITEKSSNNDNSKDLGRGDIGPEDWKDEIPKKPQEKLFNVSRNTNYSEVTNVLLQINHKHEGKYEDHSRSPTGIMPSTQKSINSQIQIDDQPEEKPEDYQKQFEEQITQATSVVNNRFPASSQQDEILNSEYDAFSHNSQKNQEQQNTQHQDTQEQLANWGQLDFSQSSFQHTSNFLPHEHHSFRNSEAHNIQSKESHKQISDTELQSSHILSQNNNESYHHNRFQQVNSHNQHAFHHSNSFHFHNSGSHRENSLTSNYGDNSASWKQHSGHSTHQHENFRNHQSHGHFSENTGDDQESRQWIFDHNVPEDFSQHQNQNEQEQQFIYLNQEHMSQSSHHTHTFSQFNKEAKNLFEQNNIDQLPDFGQQDQNAKFYVKPMEDTQKEKSGSVDSMQTHETNTDESNVKYKESIIRDKQPKATPSEKPLAEERKTNSLTEVTTEKPGFWKSVGNKFTNAKNKVSSWFGK